MSHPYFPPITGCEDQKRLLHDFLDGGRPRWVLWLDGGRYDYFADIYSDYFEGNLRPVWNRDVGYTGDWSEEFLRKEFPGMGLFTPVPLWSLDAAEYDERKWFDVTPNYREYDASDIEDRLAALGYKEHTGNDIWESHADKVNTVVRDYLPEVEDDGGVIRYVNPHPPNTGLEEWTKGSGKCTRTIRAIQNGDLSVDELHEAYEQDYRAALEGIVDILADLDGEVVITADHGECLYESCCRQVFHGRNFEKCPCLVVVPWFTVEGVVA